MHIQNEKKKFVCARIRVVIHKTFLLSSQEGYYAGITK